MIAFGNFHAHAASTNLFGNASLARWHSRLERWIGKHRAYDSKGRRLYKSTRIWYECCYHTVSHRITFLQYHLVRSEKQVRNEVTAAYMSTSTCHRRIMRAACFVPALQPRFCTYTPSLFQNILKRRMLWTSHRENVSYAPFGDVSRMTVPIHVLKCV
jgi:hypothetical protein